MNDDIAEIIKNCCDYIDDVSYKIKNPNVYLAVKSFLKQHGMDCTREYNSISQCIRINIYLSEGAIISEPIESFFTRHPEYKIIMEKIILEHI